MSRRNSKQRRIEEIEEDLKQWEVLDPVIRLDANLDPLDPNADDVFRVQAKAALRTIEANLDDVSKDVLVAFQQLLNAAMKRVTKADPTRPHYSAITEAKIRCAKTAHNYPYPRKADEPLYMLLNQGGAQLAYGQKTVVLSKTKQLIADGWKAGDFKVFEYDPNGYFVRGEVTELFVTEAAK